jgi:hypothetical protein
MPVLQIKPSSPLAPRGDFLEMPGKERPLPKAQQPLCKIFQKFRVFVGVKLELVVPVYIELSKLPVRADMVKVRVCVNDDNRLVRQAFHKRRKIPAAYRGIDQQRACLSDKQVANAGTQGLLVDSERLVVEIYGFVRGFHANISYLGYANFSIVPR